jgi:hypothetical protein
MYPSRQPEYVREYQKQWRQNRIEQQRAYKNEYMRQWRNKQVAIDPDKVKVRARRAALKHRYGITPEQYEEMLTRQDGKCAICNSKSPKDKRNRNFHVDHCHETGRIRGILCTKCNHALGRFGDDIAGVERVLKYLRGGLNGGV